jgi:hypothetical protein
MRRLLHALWLPLALVATVACGDKDDDDDDDEDDTAEDDDTGEVTDPDADEDADGYPASDDCDDSDAAVHPDADEVCDGIDNDCDDLVDDADDSVDLSTAPNWFEDADGDGFGNQAVQVTACAQPDGMVSDDTDCDDTAAEAYPGGDEVCDGLDNDCDGALDGDDPSVDLATTREWFEDADGDGDGVPGNSVVACTPPVGTSGTDTDCDDTDPSVWYGAPEVCDGQDNDCNTLVPLAERDADEDTYVTCTIDAGGWDGAAISGGDDCDDADATVHPAATEVCDGQDNDCDGSYPGTEDDGDGDGYVECTIDDGGWDGTGSPSGDDCDDTDSAVNPDATEVCDADDTDEDCSGDADDDDSGVDPSGLTTFYVDADGDGYGDGSTAGQALCDATVWFAALTDDDCDDDDAEVNPGAAEICDGADTNCDGDTTDEAGLATFTDSAGTVTDETGTLSGTAGSPAAVTVTSDGTLAVCEGTWYATLDFQASVDVVNPGGDRADVVFDAGGAGAVVTVATAALDVSFTDLTLQDGSQASGGGNVDCSGAASTVTLTGVDVTGGQGSTGGGIAVDGCDLTLDDVSVTGNAATDGGGVWVSDAGLVAVDSAITDNTATDNGAGLYVAATSTTVVSIDLDEVDVSGNIATGYGGGLYAGDAQGTVDLVATGSASTAAGFWDNDASAGGGVYLAGESDLAAESVDMGTSAGGDDNSPDDLTTVAGGTSYTSFDDDASFACAAGVCVTGAATTHTFGGTTSTATGNNSTRANLFRADGDGWIRGVSFYLNPDYTCEMDFYVMSASGLTASGWTVEHATIGVPTLATGWYDSDPMLVPVTTGTYYTFVLGMDCASGYFVEYAYNLADNGYDDITGFLDRQGGAGHNNSYTSAFAVGDSVTWDWAGTYEPARYYMQVDWSY